MSGLQKNVTSQKWMVFAFDETNHTPVTGDAANITAKISQDWGTRNASNDTNPTELEDGYYLFDLTQAETNGNALNIFPESSTGNVQVKGEPVTIYTVPENFHGLLGLLITLDSLAAETRSPNVLDQLKTIIAVIESQRSDHVHQPSTGNIFFIDNETGDPTGSGATGGISDPIDSFQDAHDTFGADFGHDLYIIVAGDESGTTEHSEDITVSNGYSFIRGPGRDLTWMPTANNTVAISVTGDGCELSGFQVEDFNGTGSQVGVQITDADFARLHNLWLNDTRGDGINILRGTNTFIGCCVFQGTGVSGSGQGVHIVGTAGSSDDTVIHDCHFANTAGDSILIEQGTTNDTEIHHCTIHNAGGWGINIGGSSTDAQVHSNILGNNASGDINDGGTDSIIRNNEQWGKQSLLVYSRFAVHIDDVDGAAGSVEGLNGTQGNPVDNLADAVLLTTGLGIKDYELHGSTSITLVSAHPDWHFVGHNGASVDPDGQNVSGSHFECLTLTGDVGGDDVSARLCKLQSLTNLTGTFDFCLLIDNATLIAGDTYFFQCASGVAGTGTPYIDLDGDDANARNLHLRGWLGGVELRTHTSTDTTSFDCPAGQIIVAASGTGGTIAMRGNIDITDNAAGAVTFSQNAAVNMSKINAEADTAISDAALATASGLAAVQADLPSTITKNTGLTDFMFFMVLTSDHVTGGTGLTVTAQRSIDGGAFGNAANSVTEIGSGVYKIDLDAADLNGDTIMLKFTAATADARLISIVTKPT